jgi:2-haloacid dehalogenase
MTKRYSLINKSQWELLEKKEKTREEVLTDRFTIFFEEIGVNVDSKKAREIYEGLLGEGHYFIEGAEELLEALYGKYDLYLASNGTESVQVRRIASSGIARYFKEIFISQALGHDKPSREYFDACFSKIPDFSPENAIIIGDSLSSDILGGKNAGIKTCLFNPTEKENKTDIIPDFEVGSLGEIPGLLERI